MKKNLLVLAVLCIAIVVSCKSLPKFSDAMGKEWKLTDVHIDGKNINFNRQTLVEEGFGEIFTLNIDAERFSGIGAPNRYNAPYTLGKEQNISLREPAITLMAPLRQPEKLKEHDYFTYIKNTHKWNLADNSLELTSKSEDGKEVRMVFVAE